MLINMERISFHPIARKVPFPLAVPPSGVDRRATPFPLLSVILALRISGGTADWKGAFYFLFMKKESGDTLFFALFWGDCKMFKLLFSGELDLRQHPK
jgi:hypothetical protein